MYDKTSRLPPVGSLKEALFLTVWLRRQELEVRKGAMLVSAVGDLIMKESSKHVVEAYKSFVDSAFPFAAKNRGDSDKELVAAMKKEAEKGAITFTPVSTPNPLQKVAKQMRLPDDFRQKLQERQQQRTRRRA